MKTTKNVVLSIAALASLFLSGCSLLITSSGKHTERVFTSNASADTIRKELGAPTNQYSYPQPVPASEIPEIVKLAKYQAGLAMDTPIASREDYVFNGREYDAHNRAASWNLDKSTLGAAEIFMFPMTVDEALYKSHLSHRYTVWYRSDGTCFAYDELTTDPRRSSK
jgi:hypothetical protein